MMYFDNNATTQLHPQALEAMLPWLREGYGNAASPYRLGRRSEEGVGVARQQVAALLGARSEREIIFTSGATEANLTAIHSAVRLQPQKRHIVTSAVEHSSIIGILADLEKQGYSITRLPVDAAGRLDPAQFTAALTPETALATIMWANNETGVLFPIPELAALAREAKVPFHTDATQAVGKIPVNLEESGVQMASLSAHKFHGPKGVGALWVSPRMRFTPLIPGSQESERRGGTSNVPGIVGMGAAAELAAAGLGRTTTSVRFLRDTLEQTLAKAIPKLRINGAGAPRLPNTSNLLFPEVDAEAMLLLLDQDGACVSTGSACTTGSLAPSHVLTAMGLSTAEARRSLRVSLSAFNTQEEVEAFAELLQKRWHALTVY